MRFRPVGVQGDVTPAEDLRLVERARAGSRRAAGELFRRHWPAVWTAAYAVTGRRALADDIAQDAFVRAFGALDEFDAQRPLGPWLRRIAVNRAIDELRHERRLRVVEDADVERLELVYDQREREDDVIAAVRRLDAAKRLVIVLHFWLGYSLEQVAEALDVPTGTVASRLSRGLAELRSDLEVDRVEWA